ncbi:GLABROUS1 enhancer-binding protein-like 3 isoform X4 [Arabidopsis lyrata subsp. lyrata]|uniref:GLABROUS1 enhancer-binding protein-like 3 isoform X4 n=1 Tax=Arabidopsis lyrata subsp. lyrata TaxID=81972 RepID=UPI000A29ADEC|nr:GLABROUS1 enhancer-binding protein-like 3 isoform X4 [Arabidopsis lyrata subsp. lyrata]|eukprot:XP_020884572.1 GLABROUS1 enhancer-binding protein-like 3 isoform X4 [Arabidopsis lyrata subsp. lyrata]
MVGTKRLVGSIDDSLTRNRDDEVEAMFRRRKQLKTTTKTTTPLSLSSSMNWSKNDELVILGGIVDYENETKLSYRSDWDAFYRYIKDSVEAKFSRKQLIDKVKSLKRKFTYNQGRSNDGEELSFTNTDDYEIFKLSLIIWAENETENVSNENMDQAKDVPCEEQENKDVPCEEQENKDVPCEEQADKDVPSVEQERVSIEIDNGEQEMSEEDDVDELGDMEDTLDSGISFHSLDYSGEKDKSEEDGVVELGVLQEVLKADTFFQSLGRYQQKLLLQNLENIGAEKRKELIDEWKALFVEELQLSIKKLTFTAKLANGGVSP